MDEYEVFLAQYHQDLQGDIEQIQKEIYELETSYLTKTKQYGNLFKGFQDYTSEKLLMVHQRRNAQIQCSERLFSLSSVTSKASKQYNQLEEKPKEVQPHTMHRLRGRPPGESRANKDEEHQRKMPVQPIERQKQKQALLTSKERIKQWKTLQKERQQEETNVQEKTSTRIIEEVHEHSQPHKLSRK